MPSSENEHPRSRTSLLVRAVAPGLCALVLAYAVLQSALAPLTNSDTYFHLRFGQLFTGLWRPWHVGGLDRFGTAHWIPTQWLSELAMYRVEDWFGLAGIETLLSAFLVLLILCWYWSARRQEADPLPSALLVVLAVVSSSGFLSARPQVISFVLATLTTTTWIRARRSGKIPWLLIPLTWLWSMLHGMWILGVILSLVAAAALLFEHRAQGRALLVGVASFGACFLTPAGPRLPLAVFEVNSRSAYYPEWAAPDFTSLSGAAALALLGLAVFLLARGNGANTFDLALVGSAAVLTVYSQRTVPIAACVLIPIISPHLQALIGRPLKFRRRERAGVVVGAVLVVGITCALASHAADRAPSFTHAFDGQLATLAPETPVLTDPADGGPMMWVHPELDFPFHGYADVYTDHELSTYADMFGLTPGWDKTLLRLGIKTAILPTDSTFAYALTNEGWHITKKADDREFLVAPSAGAN